MFVFKWAIHQVCSGELEFKGEQLQVLVVTRGFGKDIYKENKFIHYKMPLIYNAQTTMMSLK